MAALHADTAEPTKQLTAGQLQAWLETQCSMIKGFLSAHVLRIANGQQKLNYLAALPERCNNLKPAASGIKHCLSNNEHLIESNISSFSFDGLRVDRITYPLILDDEQKLLLIIELDNRSEIMQRAVINMLNWGRQWLFIVPSNTAIATTSAQETQSAAANDSEHRNLLHLAASTLEQATFSDAATALATELASALACTRVSVGARSGRYMQVRALSHSASFDHKSNSMRDIAAAMDEALEQDESITLPAPAGPAVLIRRAHKTLAANSSNPSICTLPITWQNETFLAITLERNNEHAFNAQEQQTLQQLMHLLAPILFLQLQAERSILTRIADRLRDFSKKLAGPRHGKLKIVSASLLALLLFLGFAKGEYRVSADALVEGAVQRAIVAPIDGFLAQANVRAGDVVDAEQLMGKLDDKDLKLEQLRIASEQQQLLGEYREAMAAHDNAKVSIFSARIEQANAQMKLLNEQLRRTKLLAPFAGIVIEGDLSQSLGAPVSRGDVLFKVAPLEDFKIILKVDEQDIAGIDAGQPGKLALTSLPGEQLQIKVDKITAVSRAEDQRNYFRVEATVLGDAQRLRPGMEGIGKIEAGEHKLLWIWTHKLVDWLRLKSWSLLP